MKLPKLHPGESFEGLDLLTTLLAPKKKAPATVKPFIELIGKPYTCTRTFWPTLLDYLLVSQIFTTPIYSVGVGGGRGVGGRNLTEKGAGNVWKVGKKVAKSRIPRWAEVGKIGKSYATWHNSLQS